MNDKLIQGTILLVLFLLCACSNVSNPMDDPKVLNDLSEIKRIQVQGQEILKKEYNVISPLVVDTFLILELLEKKEWAYKVYQSNSLKFLGNLGKMGPGPTELQIPRLSDQTVLNRNGSHIWVNELGQGESKLIDIGQSLKSKKNEIVNSVKYDNASILTESIFNLNSRDWIANLGPSAEKFGRFLSYSSKKDTNTLTAFNHQISNGKMLNRQDVYSLNFHYVALKPDESRVVSIMNHLSRVDIYRITTDQTLQIEATGLIKNEKYDKLDGEIFKNDYSKITNYYMDVSVTNDKIYALYHGQPSNEYAKKLISSQIRVFDWDGNLLEVINIPEYLISFSVDDINENIFGVAYFEEKIMRYSLDFNQ